jgi:hypothetical protein
VNPPCAGFGLIVHAALSDRPQDAKWLAPEERDALVPTLTAETRGRQRSINRRPAPMPNWLGVSPTSRFIVSAAKPTMVEIC